MNFSVNPREFQSLKIGTPQEQSRFLFKISQILTEMQAAISALQTIGGARLTPVIQVLNPISTNQTVNCANATMVMLDIVFTAAVTVTLTNLLPGIPISFRAVNNTAGALVLKMAASNPSGGAYGFFFFNGGGTSTDFTGVGVSFGANIQALLTGGADSANVFVGE